jgi:hypothetical protein
VLVTGLRRINRKTGIIVSVNLTIGLLHFVTGSHYSGPYPAFVNGYLLDILIPFGFYFLLCLSQLPLLRSWIVKSILVFGAASFVEIAQFFGLPILGRTYDAVDFVMYGIGVILAVILDTIVFPRIFDFWTRKAQY